MNYYYLSVNQQDIKTLVESSCLFLPLKSVGIWKKINPNDKIILFESGIKINIYAVTVEAKNILRKSSLINFNPLVISLNVEGAKKWISNFEFGEIYNFKQIFSQEEFNNTWNKCDKYFETYEDKSILLFFPYKKDKYEVTLITNEDTQFITQIAQKHSFGNTNGLLTLIIKYDNQRVGASIIEYSKESNRNHFSQFSVFGSFWDEIKENGIFIKRLFHSNTVINKIETQDTLLRAIIDISPCLTNYKISIIEGVSYDYQPAISKLGFNFEPPNELNKSYYYWKPINIPSGFNRDSSSQKQNLQRAHEIIRERNKQRYWLILINKNYEKIAFDEKKWALEQTPNNNGKWKELSTNDVCIFYDRESNKVKGYGYVKKTQLLNDSKYPRWNLWIFFHEHLVDAIEINLDKSLFEKWYYTGGKGGILSIEHEVGIEIKNQIETINSKRRMWVTPNPYLLVSTNFQVKEKQIFVVHSWLLKDTIFPEIKKILKGYTVLNAEDRDGQVIFDDIWRLMNESEAIIVDFTGKRPNVYLEFGMAIVLGKAIIAICQNKEDLPSDTPNLKAIIYSDKLGDQTLHQKLPNKVRETISDFKQ